MISIIEKVQIQLATISSLAYVDENWGQLDHYTPNFPVKWPCALIDVSNAGFSNIGIDKTTEPMNRQEGTFHLEIRIANLKLSNTSHRAPQSQKDKAHSIWIEVEEVHKKIQGFEPTEACGKLIRVGLERVRRDDGVQEYVMTYSGSIYNV